MGNGGRHPVTVYLTDELASWLEGQLGPGRTKSGVILWMIDRQREYLVGRGWRADPQRPYGPSRREVIGPGEVDRGSERSSGDGPEFEYDPQ
jgi:hypothetical protein